MSKTVAALASAATTATAVGAPHHPVSTSLEAKVVVLGSQNVGKTSLVHRYVHSSFLPANMTPSTVGASFLTARVHDPETDSTIRLQIWDTAGQERFRSISKLYYRGAHAAVLCYDITSRKSFEEMGVWLRELKEKGSALNTSEDQTILHIVGTKSDIVAEDPSKREVPFERCIDFVAQELYPESSLPSASPPVVNNLQTTATLSPNSNRSSVLWGAPDQVWDCCHEISAKDGEGIEEVFRVITRKLIEQHHNNLEKQRALDASMGRTPGMTSLYGLASSRGPGGGADYFDYRHGNAQNNAFLSPNGVTQGGSFRLGHGDKRRSWLGLGPASMTTTPGFAGLSVEEEERLKMLENRRGRCC
ncbi:P-loop containing nucleoside triphosphate hydrolase protein [Elsinoe ampelina]|uniref:P-loop containing nucleoside triphosphate hydrolase protein n=1 Tax=Elsinoe ampelina TaxID=302913 RepID=A0A6A6GIP2_9PEZI|nr:P-loop containing nucleoside triphosphate hydrolase protein [Elsinoe ampelina]